MFIVEKNVNMFVLENYVLEYYGFFFRNVLSCEVYRERWRVLGWGWFWYGWGSYYVYYYMYI